MAKSKEQKKEIIKSLSDKISRSKSIVFINFNGLEVGENEDLRKKLKENKGEYYVVKKTLLDRVLKDNKIADLNISEYDGQMAAIFGYEDEVTPAKIVDNFREEHLTKEKEEKICFIGGILDLHSDTGSKLISKEEVMFLAKLPTKPELYAKVVWSLNAPVSGFVNALAGNLRNLVYVLDAVKDKKV